ncbi:DMT family transporter [Nonomuraea sp. NPDC059194]|uniref:DMT family transporter n=1 Tax=Nonomuraea sp. NPDC059194 TaxID=3346764 RepID=UPI0036C43214
MVFRLRVTATPPAARRASERVTRSEMLRCMAVVPAPRPLLGAVLLLFVSAAWGSAFPLMKSLIDEPLHMSVTDLLAERYTIAAVALFLIRPTCLTGLTKGTWSRGIVLGIMFGVGQAMQAFALDDLSSAVSGFAVGCNVVMTPVFALVLFRVRVPRRVWYGVALALVGVAVFALMKGDGVKFAPVALGLTLCAAALYACHTLVLANFSRSNFNAYAITVIQLLTIGLLTGVVAVPDGLDAPPGPYGWLKLGHLAIVSCALGFLARSFGQRHLHAVPSAVLLSSQPLWVALIAMLCDEPVGMSVLVGGPFMAAAMLLAVPSKGEPVVVGDPPARVPQAPEADESLRRAAKQAAEALASLRTPERASPAQPVPVNLEQVRDCWIRAAERDPDAEPWCSLTRRSSGPDIERLIEHATEIIRSRQELPATEGCLTFPFSGRCLCALRPVPALETEPEEASDIGVVR